MTCYLDEAEVAREAVRVARGGVQAGPVTEKVRPRPGVHRAWVRITHACVGVTDVMAIRGDYLLQPFAGFVPGYDFVGVIECLPHKRDTGLTVGQRVAGILPRMGTHATFLEVPLSLLVAVPDTLESAAAASMPLDAVTASLAMDALPPDLGSVLVQGAGGAVGSWVVQLARRRGAAVYGTASDRSRALAESHGVKVLDYRSPGWIEELVVLSGGGVDGAVDHTGDRTLRRAVLPDGRIVRIAFGGAPGQRRFATALGGLASTGRRFARPSERVCSVPAAVLLHPARCRAALSELFQAVDEGSLRAPETQLFDFADYPDAVAAVATARPGTKVVLQMPEPAEG